MSWRERATATAQQRREDAKRALARSAAALRRGRGREAESESRRALVLLRAAMDWLEDLPGFEEAHQELDRAGREVRRRFGCRLGYKNSVYYEECPVALGHSRIGLSPKLRIVEVLCSICGQDHTECPHIVGRVYSGVECYRRITRCDVLEVSFVSRPVNPEARVTRMSVNAAQLAEALGADVRPGMPVSCDRCLSACGGLREVNF